MRFIFIILFSFLVFAQCKDRKQPAIIHPAQSLASFFNEYYEEKLKLFPMEATYSGDNRYNDTLPVTFTNSYREMIRKFYNHYLDEIKNYNRDELTEKDKLNYDVFIYELKLNLEELEFPSNYTPFNQFYAIPLTIGQWGSGMGIQPFKTVRDYDNWVKRAGGFKRWADSAVLYFQKGLIEQYVLPRALVKKMIPQMKAMITDDVTKSIFYGPVLNMPSIFSEEDKKRITADYTRLIKEKLNPAYTKLATWLEKKYILLARSSSGISSLPGGQDYYRFLVKQQTTTLKTPEEIYQIGLQEVARIRTLMDSVKSLTGFTGDLTPFFNFLRTDKQFLPYKTPGEVLDAFENIHQRMIPFVNSIFNKKPKTHFEIRQTEAFREASASAEYNQGSADGSRPGIFYVPIPDASAFNTTSGMESLFLHEAIPGHHYQISLQQEDSLLPKFLRFGGNNAFVEGWALYCESLGKELGLYKDPYQYMGALGDEMHRAVRLVVDVAIHTKNMSREQAVKYMMNNEAINEQSATAEIERYMAIPGQALGYKIGALKIKELRERYQKQLGAKFSLAAFHDELLKDGALPLDILESKMEKWADQIK